MLTSWWRLFATVLLLGTAVGVSACNTFEGLGRDVSAAGGEIEEEAQDVQQ